MAKITYSHTADEKTKFRSKKPWKEFRALLLETRGARCECCGCKYTSKRQRFLHLHHLYPSQYDILIPENFRFLCSSCHESVELLAVRLISKSKTLIRETKWLALYGEFIPKEGPAGEYLTETNYL